MVLALPAILAAGLSVPGVAQAQEPEKYIDLSVGFTVTENHNSERNLTRLWLTNQGNRTAYDVRVVLEQVNPTSFGSMNMNPCCLMGTIDVEAGENVTNNTVTWSIPSLPPHTRSSISFSVRMVSSDKAMFEWLATAESLSSYESPDRMDNNTAEAFLYGEGSSVGGVFIPQPSYYVRVSTDGASPEPGGTGEFTVEVLNKYDSNSNEYGERPPSDLVNYVTDACVNIRLSPGLTAGAATTNSDTRFPNLQYYPGGQRECGGTTAASGVLYVGGPVNLSTSPQPKLTLPVTVGAAGPHCLTAEIFATPPTGAGKHRDDPSDNVAKACLGAAPAGEQVVLSDGTVDLFTWHPCVGKTVAPCNENDSLELVVTGDAAPEFGTVFQPSQVVVQMPDGTSRTVDANGNLVWSTGFATFGSCTATPPTCLPGGEDRSGPLLRFNTTLLDLRTDTTETPPDVDRWGTPDTQYPDWERGYFKTEMSGPGKMATWDSSSSGPASEWGSSAAGYEGNPWITSSDKHLGFTDGSYIEFSKLGTYTLTATIRTPYDDDVTDSTAGVEYSDTKTYTFHVGPIQDLEVRDGGSSDVAAGRTVYTIIAANNGPENTVDATVKIALPSGAQVEDYVASEGTYANGAWTLAGLKLRDYRRSRGIPEEATLTLILKDGGVPQEPATATISLTDNSYNVCIGSDRSTLAHTTQATCVADTTAGGSWHEGTVYEYPNNNSTAKITARGGGAVGTSGGPVAPRFANTPVLTWESVPHVNNWPVHRYQVQYLDGNTWQNLAHVSGDQTHFADTGAGARRSYRVRALNEAGVPGLWSRSASQVTYRQASPPLNVTAEAGGAGEVVVSWEPSSDDGGSPITYYQAQWSRTGTGGWSNACRSDSASQHTCTNTGIPSGETRYYRVAAYAGGLGAWSDLAVATAVAGVPEAPSLSASRATSGSGDNILRAIRLTWSQPRDNGSTIYAYEIDYVDYDQVARKCGTDWEPLDGIGYRYSDSPVAREYLDAGNFGDGLEPGAYRCYRVRAVNSAGAGAWSNAASASAGGAVTPDQWLYLDGEADGQNAITLYWGEPHYDGGAPVTGYQLQYSEDGENWRNLTTTSASARSYTHTGRKVGETWHYQIRARNSAGWGGWSYPVTVTIEEGKTANLSQPTLTAQARTSKEVLLSWSSLCNPNREGDCESKGIDGYMVEYSEDGGLYGWERLTWLWTDQTKVLDSTVEPGATRYYRVAGYKEDNRRQLLGRWSQVKSATTADFSVGAPQNFRIEKEGERALRLEWDAVTEGRDAESITGYRIERSTWNGDGPGDFDTSWVVRQTNRGIGPYVETGLTPNTQYYYQVAAVTRNGAVPYIGPYSMVSIFIPPAGN